VAGGLGALRLVLLGRGWAARGRGPRGRRCPPFFIFIFLFQKQIASPIKFFLPTKIKASTSKQIKQKISAAA